MKQSIGSLWLFGIMVVFILIFACYLIVTIEYNKVYKMKNNLISMIEKYNGLSDIPVSMNNGTSPLSGQSVTIGGGTFQNINAYLMGSGYNTKGECPQGSDYKNIGEYWFGVTDLSVTDHAKYEQVVDGKKYYYCFCKIQPDPNTTRNLNGVYYYKVRLFFMFNFPVIQYLGIFDVDGTTDLIYRVDAKDTVPSSY